MSEPVVLSDEILRDARVTAAVSHRSLAGQIEFWAQLGKAIEPLLAGTRAQVTGKAGVPRALSECLASVDTDEGRKRLKDYLELQPFPHYEPAPDAPGLLVRIDQDGTRTLGRFVGREFKAAE